MNDFNFAPQGWECPKCKRVYSPTTSMCFYCPNRVTTGTTVGVGGFGVPNGTTAQCLVYTPDPNSTSDICLACNQPKSAHITFK
jgi:hypothetical protein